MVTNWYFIQLYGIEGAAIATGITLAIFNIIKLVFLKVRVGLWPFSWKNLSILVIAVVTFGMISLLPFLENLWLDIVVRSSLTALLFLVPNVVFRLSPEINDVIHQFTGWKWLKG